MRHAALLLALTLAGGAAYAQSPARSITLDVVVDRSPATPLTASDFVVTDGTQTLTVDSARLIQAPAGGAALRGVATDDDERAAAAEASRIVGIFVDEYHLAADPALVAARSVLAAFVRTRLGPRDLVVVVKPLDSLLSIRLTSDREAAARSIEGAEGRQGDYVARSTFEQNYFAGAPARIDAARNQVALSTINALATHLGQFGGGRKTLLVLGNGIATGPRGTGPLPGFDTITRNANRGHVAVYAMRPEVGAASVVKVSDQAAPADPLATLTKDTTGFTIDGTDAIEAGLGRLLSDASAYYELTLSAPPPSDGRFHAVSVTLAKPGAPIRARGGYLIAMPSPLLTAARSTVIPEGLKIPRHASPLIRTWFGQSADGDARTRVEFVWEAAPRVPGARGTPQNPARVSLKVSTLDGDDVFSGVSGPSRVDALAPGIEKPQLSFNVAPGPLVLQMDIQDAAGRTLDHDVRDLSVARFRAALGFGTIAVFRARSARDIRDLEERIDVAPAVTRQFSRAEHLVFRAPVVGSELTPTITARLTSGFGASIRELPVTAIGPSHDLAQVELSLAALASGGYQVEFSARGADGTSVVEHVAFVVTP